MEFMANNQQTTTQTTKIVISNDPDRQKEILEATTVTTTTNDQGITTEVKDVGGSIQYKIVGRYKIEIIRDKCISAASCVAIAPHVFDLDAENIAVFVENLTNENVDDDMTMLAAQSCPTAAIIVTDIESGEQVWPV